MGNNSQNGYPFIPPDDLIDTWLVMYPDTPSNRFGIEQFACYVANRQIEACCEWLRNANNHSLGEYCGQDLSDGLRAAFHPRPPSLREEALAALRRGCFPEPECIDTILRALKALPK